MPDTPMLPLLVGVTGHRDIRTDALPIIRRRIREALQGLIKLYGARQLQLLTAMAGGADLEAAEIALELGIRPVCLFPMEPERYRETLSEADRPRFDRLRADERIALQVTLPPVARAAHRAAGDGFRHDALQELSGAMPDTLVPADAVNTLKSYLPNGLSPTDAQAILRGTDNFYASSLGLIAPHLAPMSAADAAQLTSPIAGTMDGAMWLKKLSRRG